MGDDSGQEKPKGIVGSPVPVEPAYAPGPPSWWNPPDEGAFNDDWLRPSEALQFAALGGTDVVRKKWLINRLKIGVVIAAARTGPSSPMDPSLAHFVLVQPLHWQLWDDFGDDYFWQTGDAIFELYGATGFGSQTGRLVFFDVRFDPTTFDGKVNAPVESPDSIDNLYLKIEMIRAAGGTSAINAAYESLIRTGHIPDDGIGQKSQAGVSVAPSGPAKKPLPKAEAERISDLIVQFYGLAISESRALELAIGMCPEHHVARDPFLAAFRLKRGPKKRGKVPLSEK